MIVDCRSLENSRIDLCLAALNRKHLGRMSLLNKDRAIERRSENSENSHVERKHVFLRNCTQGINRLFRILKELMSVFPFFLCQLHDVPKTETPVSSESDARCKENEVSETPDPSNESVCFHYLFSLCWFCVAHPFSMLRFLCRQRRVGSTSQSTKKLMEFAQRTCVKAKSVYFCHSMAQRTFIATSCVGKPVEGLNTLIMQRRILGETRDPPGCFFLCKQSQLFVFPQR